MNLREFFTTQTWWGKLIGAFFGFLTAGPIGALFGIFIGNCFDRGLAEHFSRAHWVYYAEKNETIKKVLFETTFKVMGHLAKADGHVSLTAIKLARQLMHELRLNKTQQKSAEQFFNEGKKPNFNLNAQIVQFKKVSDGATELIKWFIDIQYQIAVKDGLSTNKLMLINSILSQLGFAALHNQQRFYEDFFQHSSAHHRSNQQSHQQQQSNSYSSTPPPHHANYHLNAAYTLLGLTPLANEIEIKRAYRRLMSKNHPDKLVAKGLSEDKLKEANEKTQRIRQAYEQVLASRKGSI